MHHRLRSDCTVGAAYASELNKNAYVHIWDWRNQPLQSGRYPYVYVNGIYLRRNWGGEFENVAILMAIASKCQRKSEPCAHENLSHL